MYLMMIHTLSKECHNMLLCHRLESFPITFEPLFIVLCICTVMSCTIINVLSLCLFPFMIV